jgi:hypothetical protein
MGTNIADMGTNLADMEANIADMGTNLADMKANIADMGTKKAAIFMRWAPSSRWSPSGLVASNIHPMALRRQARKKL